jgi:hypothetical protein
VAAKKLPIGPWPTLEDKGWDDICDDCLHLLIIMIHSGSGAGRWRTSSKAPEATH